MLSCIPSMGVWSLHIPQFKALFCHLETDNRKYKDYSEPPWKHLFCKGSVSKYFRFCRPMVSVTILPRSHFSAKAALYKILRFWLDSCKTLWTLNFGFQNIFTFHEIYFSFDFSQPLKNINTIISSLVITGGKPEFANQVCR